MPSLDQLAPDPANPRLITDDAIRGLGASLERFGELGIVWNRRTGRLVSGHQRVRALRAAGAAEWTWEAAPVQGLERPVIGDGYIEHPGTHERFRVRVVDWDEATARAANLTANNPMIGGEFTEAALEQLTTLQLDFPKFEDLQLDKLLDSLEAEFPSVGGGGGGTGNTDSDAGTEPVVEPITRPGDLWLLGKHRLLCGDATNAADVRRVMDGRHPALVIADPPYGIDYTDDVRASAAREFDRPARQPGHQDGIVGDSGTAGRVDVLQLLRDFLARALDVSEPACAFYLWHDYSQFAAVEAATRDAGLLVHRQIVWVKPSLLFSWGLYHLRHEVCAFGWLRGHMPPFYGERNQTTVWEVSYDTPPADRVHPTQKPVELFLVPMRNHTREGETCFDPFCGSGSQIIAGEQLGRTVCAIEIDPRWVDAAVKRWEAFTGRTATRA
jgi:DNA modification methylase